MESWEIELEFLTHDEYEKAIRRMNGTLNEDEFEGASEEELQAYLDQAKQDSAGGLKPQEDEWEDITNAQ